jgi:hypothetical protein
LSMRTAPFAAITTRLHLVTTALQEWAPIVQSVADDRPESVPPETVKGVSRPVEAVALARDEQGIGAELDATRAALIQAVLYAERAAWHASRAEQRFTGTDLEGGMQPANRVRPTE